MLNQHDIAIEHAVKGKIIYLLALIVLVQFGYPVSTYGTLALVLYELLYVSMISVGVILGRDSLRHMLFLGFAGFTFRLPACCTLSTPRSPGQFWSPICP